MKRLIAAAGYSADEITHRRRSPSTTCAPAAGSRRTAWRTWTSTASRPRCASRTIRASAARSSCGARTKSWLVLCVEAYNDWMVEEWCGDSDGRLIPLCLVPLWDAALAAAEVRRNAARGVRAVAFSELPPYLGLPSIYSGHWDPFFAACDETGTVVCMHIGSGTKTPRRRPTRPRPSPAPSSSATASAPWPTTCYSGVFVAVPEPEDDARRGPDRLDPVSARAHRRRVGDAPRLEPQPAVHERAAVDATTAGSHLLDCFFKDPVGIEHARPRRRRTTSSSKPTTRIRTARGRSRANRPRSSSVTSTRRRSTRSPAATRSASSASISDPRLATHNRPNQRGQVSTRIYIHETININIRHRKDYLDHFCGVWAPRQSRALRHALLRRVGDQRQHRGVARGDRHVGAR